MSTTVKLSLTTPENITEFLALSAAAGESGTPCHQAPEAWFNKSTQHDAAARCREACPIQAQCLQFAMNSKQTEGVWGGTTEAERAAYHLGEKRRQRAVWARERAARAAALEPTLDDALFGAMAS